MWAMIPWMVVVALPPAVVIWIALKIFRPEFRPKFEDLMVWSSAGITFLIIFGMFIVVPAAMFVVWIIGKWR